MKHQLIKEMGIWRCKTCQRQWQRKPRGECVGMLVKNELDLSFEVTQSILLPLNRRLKEGAKAIAFYGGKDSRLGRNEYIYSLKAQGVTSDL